MALNLLNQAIMPHSFIYLFTHSVDKTHQLKEVYVQQRFCKIYDPLPLYQFIK